MNKQKKYKFGEIVWVVGHGSGSLTEIFPLVYKTDGDNNTLSTIDGKYSHQCKDIEHGIRKFLAIQEYIFMPNATEIENEYCIIKNVDIFKMALYGLKEKATILANNFHYRGMIFNAEDYYNLKIANKEYTVEKLYKLAEKASEIYYKKYEDSLPEFYYFYKLLLESDLKEYNEKYNEEINFEETEMIN